MITFSMSNRKQMKYIHFEQMALFVLAMFLLFAHKKRFRYYVIAINAKIANGQWLIVDTLPRAERGSAIGCVNDTLAIIGLFS